MDIETHIDRARSRVAAEQEQITGEQRAYEQFRSEIDGVSVPSQSHQASERVTTAGSVAAQSIQHRNQSDDPCRSIRDAFAETVYPYSVADLDGDEPLLETVREELGESIAVVLSPRTDQGVTPQIQAAIHSKITTKQHELDATERALNRERGSLCAAHDDLESVGDWLIRANEAPLETLSFERLREYHESLDSHKRTCRSRLQNRQEFLQRTTSCGGNAGVTHRSLVTYLYQDFPVSYPVVSTFTRLYELLSECQRTLRKQLVRTV